MLKRIVIQNFKIFEKAFTLEIESNNLIIVGDNESGKSTILEAIHLATTGLYRGKPISTEISQYLFNSKSTDQYLQSLKTPLKLPLPEITIELYIDPDSSDASLFCGDDNSQGSAACGFVFRIGMTKGLGGEYEEFVRSGPINSLPVEYYSASWRDFAREDCTPRSLPMRSTLIDSSAYRYQHGTDMYVSRIIKEDLDDSDIVRVSQAHRKMKESFQADPSIANINSRISKRSTLTNKSIKLSVDLGTKMAWETTLSAELDDVPFQQYGKGIQCMVKTELAIGSKGSSKANIILFEEPENHLSHANLNAMLNRIKEDMGQKQSVMTTHSSFVANKLSLDNLAILAHNRVLFLNNLEKSTKSFFEKVPGYDTLRFVLCDKAILVEGPSDELVIQKAYMTVHDKRLPIEDGIDVISVGLSFLRFLEIAGKLRKETIIITDNDGSVRNLEKKYSKFLQEEYRSFIRIEYDSFESPRELIVRDVRVSFNTLESCLLRSNGLDRMKKIFDKDLDSEDEMLYFMQANKTECALQIFQTSEEMNFPDYILRAIG